MNYSSGGKHDSPFFKKKVIQLKQCNAMNKEIERKSPQEREKMEERLDDLQYTNNNRKQ
jgi:hypothetical protein